MRVIFKEPPYKPGVSLVAALATSSTAPVSLVVTTADFKKVGAALPKRNPSPSRAFDAVLPPIKALRLSDHRQLSAFAWIRGQHEHLRWLDMRITDLNYLGNRVKGYTNLEVLVVSANPLQDPDGQAIAGVSVGLKELWAHDSGLTTLPKNIGAFSKLEVLTVGDHLSAVPPALGKLPRLRLLSLRGTFSALPSLDGLHALTKLSLGSGELTKFPSLKLPALEVLQIENCHQLRKLELAPSKLPKLKQLIVDHCPAISAESLASLRAAFGKKLKITKS